MKKSGFVALFVLMAGEVQAHPDHAGDAAFGLSHLVTDPFHLSLIAAVVGLALAARFLVQRSSR